MHVCKITLRSAFNNTCTLIILFITCVVSWQNEMLHDQKFIIHPVHYPSRDLLRRLAIYRPVKAWSHDLHYHTNDLNAEKTQPSGDLNSRQHAV